jgi:hypothetical protein
MVPPVSVVPQMRGGYSVSFSPSFQFGDVTVDSEERMQALAALIKREMRDELMQLIELVVMSDG